MDGRIVTFYSYKGGVGRSFLLANIATILARWGARVLCVDWDLEAPGLDNYFGDQVRPGGRGLVSLIETLAQSDAEFDRRALEAYEQPVILHEAKGALFLLRAGTHEDNYFQRVQALDWENLYRSNKLGSRLEQLRNLWKSSFDFVLIDSRTGFTDTGGVCTVQMPDTLVLVFAPNQQNVDGIVRAYSRIEEARNDFPYDRSRLLTLPVLSRFDQRAESRLAAAWLEKCAQQMSPLLSGWISKGWTAQKYFAKVNIPYFSRFAFGENLTLDEGYNASPELIGYHFDTVAALIAHDAANDMQLDEERDAYVLSARSSQQKGFAFEYGVLPASDATKDQADELCAALTKYAKPPSMMVAKQFDAKNLTTVVRHLVIVYAGEMPATTETMLAHFQRLVSLRSGSGPARKLIPVFLPKAQLVDASNSLLYSLKKIEYPPGETERTVEDIIAYAAGQAILSDRTDAESKLRHQRTLQRMQQAKTDLLIHEIEERKQETTAYRIRNAVLAVGALMVGIVLIPLAVDYYKRNVAQQAVTAARAQALPLQFALTEYFAKNDCLPASQQDLESVVTLPPGTPALALIQATGRPGMLRLYTEGNAPNVLLWPSASIGKLAWHCSADGIVDAEFMPEDCRSAPSNVSEIPACQIEKSPETTEPANPETPHQDVSATITKLLGDLTSDDTTVRRGARKSLSSVYEQDPALTIQLLLNALRPSGQPETYRTNLGIAEALGGITPFWQGSDADLEKIQALLRSKEAAADPTFRRSVETAERKFRRNFAG